MSRQSRSHKKRVKTHFGRRLADPRDDVRALAESELRALGPRAVRVLNDEMTARGTNVSNGLFSAIAVAGQALFQLLRLIPPFDRSLSFGYFSLLCLLIALVVGYWLDRAVYRRWWRESMALAMALQRHGGGVRTMTLVQLWHPQAQRNSSPPVEPLMSELIHRIELYRASPKTAHFSDSDFQLIRYKMWQHYGKNGKPFHKVIAPTWDLSDTEADLMAACALLLGATRNAENLALLQTIAATPTHFPNRRLIREAAAAVLGIEIAPDPAPVSRPQTALAIIPSPTAPIRVSAASADVADQTVPLKRS